MRKINHPHLTAIHRKNISLPTRELIKRDLLVGRILDFGCGHGADTDILKAKGFNIIGYDNYYRKEFPDGKFDTIICQYVLNVLEFTDQMKVIAQVLSLLTPSGRAYFSVRRDLVNEGFRIHAIYKQWTYQENVILPFDSIIHNSTFEIYLYVNNT